MAIHATPCARCKGPANVEAGPRRTNERGKPRNATGFICDDCADRIKTEGLAMSEADIISVVKRGVELGLDDESLARSLHVSAEEYAGWKRLAGV